MFGQHLRRNFLHEIRVREFLLGFLDVTLKFFAFLATRAAELRRQREAIDRALEAVWTGTRTPVEALSFVSY